MFEHERKIVVSSTWYLILFFYSTRIILSSVNGCHKPSRHTFDYIVHKNLFFFFGVCRANTDSVKRKGEWRACFCASHNKVEESRVLSTTDSVWWRPFSQRFSHITDERWAWSNHRCPTSIKLTHLRHLHSPSKVIWCMQEEKRRVNEKLQNKEKEKNC